MDFEILEKLLTVFTAEDIIYALLENEKKSLAIDKNCPKEILGKLAEDSNEYIRMCIAGKNNCPEDIIRKLAEDDNESVQKQARVHLA